MRWWARLLRRGRVEHELDAELRYHVDRRVDELVASGLDREEAHRAVRLEFGGLDQIKERCRDARGTRWLVDAAADVRYTARRLLRDRAYAAVAIAALALAIAVNNTQFAIVDGYCIRGLPIVRADRVAFVGTIDRTRGPGGLSYSEFDDLQRRTTAFQPLAAFAVVPVALAAAGRAADGVTAAYLSAAGLRALGRDPILGRGFSEADGHAGAPLAVVLSQRIWRARFDGDPAIVGRPVRVDGAAGTVVGVMPDGFTFPGHADIWVPLERMPGVGAAARDARTLGVFGRLGDGVALDAARAELEVISRQLAAEHPDSNAHVTFTAEPINAHFNGRLTDPAWIAFTIVGVLVVVIGCANVANLLLMRSAVRSREIAMRRALGATDWRIARLVLVESAAFAVLGALAGLALSAFGLRLFVHAIPESAIPFGGLGFNGHVFGVLAGVTLLTTVLCGLLPALRAARTDVAGALKAGSVSMTHGVSLGRWTTALLTVEFALTVVLVSAVGLSVATFRARDATARIDRDHLLTLRLAAPASRYAAPALRADLYERLADRLAAIPGVTAVSFTSTLALAGPPSEVAREGQAPAGAPGRMTVPALFVDEAYFRALGLSLTGGRAFARRPDNEAVVNERLAHLLFPDGTAIGRRIRVAPAKQDPARSPWLTIVGVAPDLRQAAGASPDPIVYLAFAASLPARPALLIRAAGDPAALAPLVREQVRAVDPDLPIVALQTAVQAERDAGWNGRMSQAIIMTIATIALALAAVGLYAVTAYGVARRTREIALRIALGANARAVTWLVLRRALAQVALGAVAGVALEAVWSRLFGGTNDPVNLASTIAVLALVALAASAAPVVRALRVDPIAVLRE